VRILYIGLVTVIQLNTLPYLSLEPAYGQNVSAADQFRDDLKKCAVQQNIAVGQDVINSIGDIYADPVTRNALKDASVFLALMPEKERVAVYKLYVQCITNVLPQDLRSQPPQATVTYKVCSGEYERECPPHDVYFYCYTDVGAWAKSLCTSYTVQRLTTFGGNKCGYSLDAVICAGPNK
jgi:hypothetical protein